MTSDESPDPDETDATDDTHEDDFLDELDQESPEDVSSGESPEDVLPGRSSPEESRERRADESPTGSAGESPTESAGESPAEPTEPPSTGSSESAESTESPAESPDASPGEPSAPVEPAAEESPDGSARDLGDAPATGGRPTSESRGAATDEGWGRSLAYLGYGAVSVGFGGVLAAMVLTPWFSVFTGALSFLGFRRVAVAPLFNGSLIVGGALATGLVAALWATAEQPFHLAAVPFLFLATVSMSLVGRFPLTTGPHVAVSVAFFAFLTVGVFLWGVGDYAAGRAGRAATFLLLPVVHAVAWAWWFALPWSPRGIALPELAGVLALVVWAVWVSADLHGLTRDPLPV